MHRKISRQRTIRNLFVELDVQRLIIEPLLQWLGYDTFDFDVVKEQVSIKNSGQKTFHIEYFEDTIINLDDVLCVARIYMNFFVRLWSVSMLYHALSRALFGQGDWV